MAMAMTMTKLILILNFDIDIEKVIFAIVKNDLRLMINDF